MTAEQIKETGLPITKPTPEDCLTVAAGLEWLLAHTTLEFDPENVEDVKALPPCAKLFLMKFREVMNMGTGVVSESIQGLSQSFSSEEKGWLIRQYAGELLNGYLKSEVSFFPAVSRWRE